MTGVHGVMTGVRGTGRDGLAMTGVHMTWVDGLAMTGAKIAFHT
jgi:hypothetical protein